jgi:G protein-coupled receptor GPR1
MEGYVAGAANCYLPVRPFWYRLALAWIPRYIIFFLILALDAAVYFYIQHKFGSFTDTFRCPRNSKADLHNLTADEAVGNVARPPKVRRSHSVPPTPQLECNGLAPQLEENGLLPPTDLEAGQSTQPQPRRQPRQAFRNLVPGGDGPSDGSYGFPHVGSGEGQRSSQNGTGHSRVGTMTTISAATPLETPTSWYSLRSFLRRRQTNQESSISTPLSQIQLFDSRTGSNLLEAPILEQRAKIRHQLRFLFIYPIAYLLMWTIPFAAHTIQYNDEYVLNPPYALNALVVVILTSQCTMDCILFSWKEKPWAHARRRQKTLAERGEEVADWWRGRGHKQGNGVATLRRPGGAKGQGKSNKERAAEARVAYRRRDIEASSAAAEGGTRAREREERGERSWWDEFDVGADGNVSPPVAGNGAAPASRVPRAMDGAMSSDVGERTVPASRDGDVTEYGIQMRDFGAGRHDA